MSTLRLVIAAAALTAGAVGCSSPAPDYSSLWTTSSSPTTAAESSDPTKPTPIAEYLNSVGVTGLQVPLDKLSGGLTVTMPRPPGWTKYSNPNFSPGTEAIAKNNTYPTAMVMVFKLDGDFDIAEALKHASADAELSEQFEKLNSSDAKFMGFPSSMIEGTYNIKTTRLHTYNRVVIPTAADNQRYLVQFTVTTLAKQAESQGAEVEGVIKGFTVTVKK